MEQNGEKIEVTARNWDCLVQNMLMLVKLHLAATKPRGEVLQYHICIGKPIYSSSLKQVEAISTEKFASEELVYSVLADEAFENDRSSC